MKIMATSFKRSQAGTATLSTLNPAAGHGRPMPPPETPGHLQASLGQSLGGGHYPHLNAEFQRIARRDLKKAFLGDQCKEIEENNTMRKTR